MTLVSLGMFRLRSDFDAQMQIDEVIRSISTGWTKSRHDKTASEASGSYNCRPRVRSFAGFGIVQDFLKDFPRVMGSKKSLVARGYQTPGHLLERATEPPRPM